MQPKLSVFANVSPASFKGHYTTDDVLKTIRSDKFKIPTDHLRTLTDAEAARIYKAGKQDDKGRLVEPGHFYGVTWSGTFENGKRVEHLQGHSGLLCMDVDGLTAQQVMALYEQLRTDEYTHILFISPSGNGLKWVVRIDLQHRDQHKAFFRQLSDYLHDSYELSRKEDVPKGTKPQIDPSGSDVSRLCFLPHAPDAYHNPDSEVMPLLAEYQPVTEAPKPPPPDLFTEQPPTDDPTHQRLTHCISELQRSGIDLTATYEDWVKIGLSFASMGEDGRTYYHEVSRFYPKYDYTETDAKFTELLRNRTGQVNIGSFFHLCEEAIGTVPKATYNYRTDRPNAAQPDTVYEWSQPNQPPTDTPPPVHREWPDLQPLKNPLLAVMPITPDMIPESLHPWLTDVAFRMKCPLDFVASAAVVMLSSLIGTRLSIKPKTRDDWTVVPNLWGAVIGGPSAMKTPSTTEVLKPLNRLIFAAREKFGDEVRAYEIAMVDYEAQKKAHAAQAQERHKGKPVPNPVEYPQAPQKPKERRYMVNDTTIEKLADLMNENPTGILLFRDELTGLLASWDRTGHEQDRAFHLEAWNGTGHITVDRIARGTTHVDIICESLFGGIQPTKLLPYLQAATGYENDGFVQRLQVTVMPDPAPWQYDDEYPDKQARDRAFSLIQAIADADFKEIGFDADDYNKFPYTRFNAEAQEVFKQWLIEWEEFVLPNESGLLLEHFTKYRSLMPSLALVFHVVNCIDNPQPASGTGKQFVTADATRMAVRWCDYLKSHARRIYGLLDTATIESAKELLQHLKAGDLKDGFKVRDVYRKQWANLKSTEQAEATVSELVNRHYLEEVQPPPTKGGRPEAPHYLISPKIHPKA
jgi:hypothetical protein